MAVRILKSVNGQTLQASTLDVFYGAGLLTNGTAMSIKGNNAGTVTLSLANVGTGSFILDVTGNITVSGTVDGVDVSSHVSRHHSGGADALSHDSIAGSGTNTHGQIDTHITSTSNPHSTSIANIGGGTLAQLNSAISDNDVVGTDDSRLTNSRTCNNTFDSAATARTNLDVYSTSQVDSKVVGLYDHKGAYDAATNIPDLDAFPSGIKKGDAYTVSAAGNFFTEAVEIGDVLIADQDDPTALGHWTRVNKNLSFGTTAGTACEGNDSRLSDARTPTAHVTSHQDGGADEISVTGLSGELSDAQKVAVQDDGTPVSTQKTLNFKSGTNTTASATLNGAVIDIQIDSTPGEIKWTGTGAVAIGQDELVYKNAVNGEVAKAIATAVATAKVVGVAAEAIGMAGTGKVQQLGIHNIKFDAGLSPVAGQLVYLSRTNAGHASISPPADSDNGYAITRIGYIFDTLSYIGTLGQVMKVVMDIEYPIEIAD